MSGYLVNQVFAFHFQICQAQLVKPQNLGRLHQLQANIWFVNRSQTHLLTQLIGQGHHVQGSVFGLFCGYVFVTGHNNR